MPRTQRAKLIITLIVFLAWAVGSINLLSAHESAADPAQEAAHDHGLQAIAADTAPAWACPMHPEVRQHEPGRCPKCKMKLVQDDAAE